MNLLAVGLYHLFEQHSKKVTALVKAQNRVPPDFERLVDSSTVVELKHAANAAKHAHGWSAEHLRSRRPDLFVPSFLRGSPLGNRIASGAPAFENPLGGTDLFLSEADLQTYRDALRELWEQVLPGL